MMSQPSFSDAEGQAKRKQTRREKFLADMDTFYRCFFIILQLERPYSMARGCFRVHCNGLLTLLT